MRWDTAGMGSGALILVLWAAACGGGSAGSSNDGGGGGGGGGPLGAVPSCSGATSDGVVKVQGTLGGQTVNVDQSPVSGEFSQLTTGQFDLPPSFTINDAAVDVDPGSVEIHLTWTGLVADGASGAATGTIEFPAGDPYAQMSLCAGSGSMISPNGQDNGVDFVLANLTLGPACTQAVAGELRGCWGYASSN